MNTHWDVQFRYILMIFLLILVVATLWYVRELLRPLLMAGLIAYFLSPVVALLMNRLRLKRKTAAAITYFMALAILLFLLGVVLPASMDDMQVLMNDFNRSLDGLQVVLQPPLHVGNTNIYLGSFIPTIRSTFSNAIVPQPAEALRLLQGTSRNFLWLLVIIVTAYYLMTDWERLRVWFIQIAPIHLQSDLYRLYAEIRLVWINYLGGQIRLIFVLMIMYSIAWQLIGLPGALLLGFMAGLLNFLPEVGPLAAALLATVVALIEGSTYLPLTHLWFAALTLGVYLLLNNIKTIWLQPRILGHSVLLHEAVVFVALIAAIVLQGIIGVLVVIPVLATLVVIGRYLRRRLLGLPPFDDEPLASAPDLSPVATSPAESQPKR